MLAVWYKFNIVYYYAWIKLVNVDSYKLDFKIFVRPFKKKFMICC
jgi:hypothetical protein